MRSTRKRKSLSPSDTVSNKSNDNNNNNNNNNNEEQNDNDSETVFDAIVTEFSPTRDSPEKGSPSEPAVYNERLHKEFEEYRKLQQSRRLDRVRKVINQLKDENGVTLPIVFHAIIQASGYIPKAREFLANPQ